MGSIWPVPGRTRVAASPVDRERTPPDRSCPTPSSASRLADLEQVTVRVAEEASDLMAPVMGRREEVRAALEEGLVGGPAVGHPDRDRMADRRGVRCLEGHIGLVLGRSAPR